MKFKKFMLFLLVVVLLCSSIPANAYTNTCSGKWNGTTDISYSYCSDGTLVVSGDTGTEVVTTPSAGVVGSGDIKELYIKNLADIDVDCNGEFYMFETSYANSIEYCYLDVIEMCYVLSNTYSSSNLKEIVFGNNVTTLGAYILEPTEGLRITMPSTITSIDVDWLYNFSYLTDNITIVCEYGSEAYNWAIEQQSKGYDGVNIELMTTVAKSSVALDNRQSYQIIVPESIELVKTESGWCCDTYLGVVGSIESNVYIKTNKSFNIIGDDIPSTEAVSVISNDENLVDDEDLLIIKLDSSSLASASDKIEVNGIEEDGYKIDYTCKVNSVQVMKQRYSGYMEFIITD